MPAISVIIPVYKVERYLDACVASVAAQTFSDLEILLVDDGSPDSCPALCDAWARKDPRVRVLHRETAAFRRPAIPASRRPRGASSPLWTPMICWNRTLYVVPGKPSSSTTPTW